MQSDSPGRRLYLVQVVYGDGIREHVADTDCDTFTAALAVAHKVRRWLSEGWAVDLPDAALDLRAELEDAGHDPRTVQVQVVRLEPAKRTPDGVLRWNLNGRVLVTVADAPRYECDEDCDDTPLMPALPRVRVLR